MMGRIWSDAELRVTEWPCSAPRRRPNPSRACTARLSACRPSSPAGILHFLLPAVPSAATVHLHLPLPPPGKPLPTSCPGHPPVESQSQPYLLCRSFRHSPTAADALARRFRRTHLHHGDYLSFIQQILQIPSHVPYTLTGCTDSEINHPDSQNRA